MAGVRGIALNCGRAFGGRAWHARAAVGLSLIAATPIVAQAGSMDLPFDIDADYKVTTTYALAVRTQDQAQALINGPVDPFQSEVFPPGGGDVRLVGFSHTGLPTTINLDDGDRNFDRWAPINNRLSAFWQLNLHKDNYGFLASGSGFYDWVFHQTNDNDSPDTVNKTTGDNNEFTEGAKYYNGERSRMLEAYAYADFYLTDSIAMNVRLGKHLVAWGESLFFPGIVSAQAPNDATKAFVPGAEIKEILLPVNQVSFQLALGYKLSLLGYYQFDYQPTEVFPVGDFFSVADVVGPGAEFAYGSGNPAYAEECPGLLSVPGVADFSFLCTLGNGVGGTVLNAPRTINVPREADIRPDSEGQWGVGLKSQITTDTSIGAYYLRYHNHNPTVNLNFGFAEIGYIGDTPVTTGVINQAVPVSYNIKYFGDIEMMAMSYSTTLLGLNVAGEFIYRDGVDVSAAADISGVLSPVFTRANTYQANISSLYVSNPKFLFYDEFVIVSEAAYLYVDKVDPIPEFNGQVPRGDGTELFYDRNAWAYQLLMLPKGRNVLPGWDIGTPIAFAHAANGYASTAGTFGALFGEGDKRIGLSVTAQYLQNLELAVSYNWFLGNPRATMRDSPIPTNPVADRDYVSLSIKYNL
ncbi:DUF1302 domain-containing protein [Sinimarinibacterium sp. CAU 1509]|uniref:DUF1302 domain-containing protein n=1 Tax=Sinimarinibacterium sp. CAU 1509 TaxID=2562283 RepID=UPI0010AC8D2F|nr:DUF1302 family protein [Sinimarinibacterium sp. CAU 1509]TJY64908.1 DUF1302 domain-containing protein [Sinimarinibacterium sp. CAU 1509]